jgi:hypothetical protein
VKCHKMFGDNKRMKGLIQSFSWVFMLKN